VLFRLLSVSIFGQLITLGGTIAATCANQTGSPDLVDPVPYSAVTPVPIAGGTFDCGGFTFTFGDHSGVAGIAGAFKVGPSIKPVLLEVVPDVTQTRWLYQASEPFGIAQITLPNLSNSLSSNPGSFTGNPIVTEHFCTSETCPPDDFFHFPNNAPLTATPLSGDGGLPKCCQSSVFVELTFATDITNGTIHSLDTIFFTPEPISTLLLASGLLVLCGARRRCLRSRLRR
jgi:hypothetical protein